MYSICIFTYLYWTREIVENGGLSFEYHSIFLMLLSRNKNSTAILHSIILIWKNLTSGYYFWRYLSQKPTSFIVLLFFEIIPLIAVPLVLSKKISLEVPLLHWITIVPSSFNRHFSGVCAIFSNTTLTWNFLHSVLQEMMVNETR